MKTFVLMISRQFPQGHRSHPKATNFESLIGQGIKIHSLRENFEYWAARIVQVQRGEARLSIREWVGKPYGKGSTQRVLFNLGKDDGVGIEPIWQCLDLFYWDAGMENVVYLDPLARNDGLTLADFEHWFGNAMKKRRLAIIHFTPFRYRGQNPWLNGSTIRTTRHGQ